MTGRPNMGGLLHPDWREVGRWAVAGVVVVGVHAGAAMAIHTYQPEDSGGDIAAPIMIDMEPMPAPVVAQPVKEEPAIEPEPIEPEVVEHEAATPEVVPEPEQVEPVEEVAEAEPEPEEVEPLEEQTEELVELPKVEVPLPVVRPRLEKPKKPVEKKIVRKVEKPVTAEVKNDKPVEEKRQAAPSAASVRQAEKWQSRVQAYLSRRAKRAKADGSGTVTVRFVVSRSGDIVGASVVGSSGSSQLDQSVLDTVRNASPVPSAPDEVTVSRQSFTVPFRIQ